MTLRAIWKGVLCFGSFRVPVKLYSAVQDRGVHFRLLHASDGVPIKQRLVDPQRGEAIPQEQVQRGYELEPGLLVRLRAQELAQLTPAPSRDIELVAFVPSEALDDPWLERPYYLGPDGAHDDPSSLARMLEQEGRVGIARWVMRKRHYTGALFGRQGQLVLSTLRPAEAVVALPKAPNLPQPWGTEEEKLAEQLIDTLSGDFDVHAYRDDYQHALRRFLQQKLGGEATPRRRVTKEPAAKPLGEVLRASLRATQRRRSA